MTEDRFSEDEIRQVFERASAMQARTEAPADGLTVAEMAEIGEASGIPRALVEAAAREVRMGVPETARDTFGPIPVGVRRTAFLDAAPTDALWERLVADARRTFDARGTAEAVGAERTWRNGNLRMTLEPAPRGSRLGLRSDRRGNTAGLMGAAGSQVVVAVMMVVMAVGADDLGPPVWAMAVMFALLGAVIAGSAWARQRAWAETREQQMAGLAERASAPVAEAQGTLTAEARGGLPLLDLDALGLDDLGDDARPDDAAEAPRRRARS